MMEDGFRNRERGVDFIRLLEPNFGEIPLPVLLAFQNFKGNPSISLQESRELYLQSLITALKARPEHKMERFKLLARLAFSFINFLYELIKTSKIPDKFKFILGLPNYLSENMEYLISASIKTLLENRPVSANNDANDYKSDYLDYYDRLFVILKNKNPETGQLGFTKTQFKNKIRNGTHPLFSRYVIEAYRLLFQEIDKFAPFIVGLESVIHGIDDYVDVDDRSQADYFSDMANVILGLCAILVLVFDYQKHNLTDSLLTLFRKKAKYELILNALKDSLLDLSWTPLVENDVAGILNMSGEEEEMTLARKNLETRTRGTTRTITQPIRIFLDLNSKEDDLFAELIWILRAEQMLFKDITDIPNDIKNKDYKAPAIWFLKYGRSDTFRNRIRALSDYYFKKAFELKAMIPVRYSASVNFLMQEISLLHSNISKTVTD